MRVIGKQEEGVVGCELRLGVGFGSEGLHDVAVEVGLVAFVAIGEVVHSMNVFIDIVFESVISNHHEAILMAKADAFSGSEITIPMNNLLNNDFINDHSVPELEDPLERIEVEDHQEYGQLGAICRNAGTGAPE